MKERSIPAWAIRNPYAVIAAYLALAIAAIATALFVLPTRMMPYVQSPLIAVVTMTPGYSPQEVETYFSKPIEERMTNLKGVRYVDSISQQDLSIVTLQFNYGYDMQRALVDVQQLVGQAEADLPYDRANLKPSYVLPVDPLNTPVLDLAVTGSAWDPVRLREFVANQVTDELKTIPNVQQVTVFGGRQRQLRVIVNRTAAAAYGISLLDIQNALDAQNISRSGGIVTNETSEFIVRGDQRILSPEQVMDYPIMTVGGRTIYVRDLARVVDGAAEERQAYRYNGQDAVELSIVENPDASSPQVIAAVMQRVASIAGQYPGLQFEPAYDNSRFVGDLKGNMFEELLVSVVLAGIVLLIFLEDLSATVIAMTTIPVCLGIAVLLFVPMRFSINSSTLLGLLLAIGPLVDGSIVVIHSVHRHLKMGKAPANAAVDGTMEVVVPVAAANAVMMLSIVPLVTSGGLTQIMFVGLVWPIVFALFASLAISLTLTPFLAAHLFIAESSSPFGWRTKADALVSQVLRPAHRALNNVEDAYRRGLRWSLENRLLVLGSAAILTYVAFSLYAFIGSEMMPLADTGQAYAFLEMAPGTSFAATAAASARVEQMLRAQPEVRKVSTEIGEQDANGYVNGQAMNGVNDVSYMLTFAPKEERRRSIWQVMDAVYAQAMRTIPGIRRLALKEMGSDVMASNQAPIEVLVYGPDLTTLHRIADQVAMIARGVPGMVQVSTSSSALQPEESIHVDRTLASQLGLTPSDVLMQAYYAMHGGYTTEFFNPANLRHSPILVRYADAERNTTGDLQYAQIIGKDGASVPLSALATVHRDYGPTLIEHDQLRRGVYVLGYYRKGTDEMGLFNTVMMRAMTQIPMPQGYGIAMRGDMTEMMQSFSRLVDAMLLAIVFVFLLLVAQFRSFTQPLVMLLAIPLQFLGVFGGLLLAHQNFSTVSILGIVVANGMAVSNAIILLDVILRKRAEGIPRDQAVLEAGPIRLRPIMMTTIVSVSVLAPVAFFPKTGIDAYSPLAVVVIGGFGISTLLTLFVVPVLHATFDDLSQRAQAWRTGNGSRYIEETRA